MKLTHATYEIKHYRQFFSDERWDEIQRIIHNWVNPKLEDGRTITGCIMNPETRIIFIGKSYDELANHMKEYYSKHVFEEILTEEESVLCQSLCSKMFRENYERRLFEKAKKIFEYQWDGPVFYGDDFYMSVDDMRDMLDCDDDQIPEYVFASEECQTFKESDLEYMIDSHFDRIGGFEDWEPNNPAIPNYLKEAWKRFVDENSETYYEQDHDTIIILNTEKHDN